MKRNVSVVCVCSAPNWCDKEQRSASQPGSVVSGTPYISLYLACCVNGNSVDFYSGDISFGVRIPIMVRDFSLKEV